MEEEDREKSFEFVRSIPKTQHFVKVISVSDIETRNIYWARMEAFLEFVLELDELFESKVVFVVDGPRLSISSQRMKERKFRTQWERIRPRVFAYPKADGNYFTVAAASIVAKVSRDRFMRGLASEFPEYNWHSNKGYSTSDHWKVIHKKGLSPHHRKTFCLKYMADTDAAKQQVQLDL